MTARSRIARTPLPERHPRESGDPAFRRKPAYGGFSFLQDALIPASAWTRAEPGSSLSIRSSKSKRNPPRGGFLFFRSLPECMPPVGDARNLLPIAIDARMVRDLRHRGDFPKTRTMTHRLHLAATTPSPKRDASLRACEWRVALPLACGMRNYFGSNSID